jgi:hypothetical protein
MYRKPHNMSETCIADTAVVEICLTLRGWRHIQNLCGFSTPTAMGQLFIMTLYNTTFYPQRTTQQYAQEDVARHLTPLHASSSNGCNGGLLVYCLSNSVIFVKNNSCLKIERNSFAAVAGKT